jgi:hypothetical protein
LVEYTSHHRSYTEIVYPFLTRLKQSTKARGAKHTSRRRSLKHAQHSSHQTISALSPDATGYRHRPSSIPANRRRQARYSTPHGPHPQFVTIAISCACSCRRRTAYSLSHCPPWSRCLGESGHASAEPPSSRSSGP